MQEEIMKLPADWRANLAQDIAHATRSLIQGVSVCLHPLHLIRVAPHFAMNAQKMVVEVCL